MYQFSLFAFLSKSINWMRLSEFIKNKKDPNRQTKQSRQKFYEYFLCTNRYKIFRKRFSLITNLMLFNRKDKINFSKWSSSEYSSVQHIILKGIDVKVWIFSGMQTSNIVRKPKCFRGSTGNKLFPLD